MSKKIVYKKVEVKNFELTQKRKIDSKYNKFKLWVAKVLKLELVDKYQYLFRVQYYGRTKLNTHDILFNNDGVVFVVMNESNRFAMLVTKDSFVSKPNLYGGLRILEDPEENKTNLKKA